MMGTDHKTILQKLEGANRKEKHTDGIIEILNRLNLQPVEFFEKSVYEDAKGEKRPCYKCTRKGCEFLAHKFNGEKGIQFTAEYINRFHSMESKILSSAPAVLSEDDIDILTEKVAGKLLEKSRENTGIESDSIYSEYGSSQYEVAEEYTIEIRKQELYSITMKAAELFGENHSSILHQMYKALEKKLGIVLDAYKSVYRTETGRNEANMVEVIAANDKIYDAAIDLNRYVIEKRPYTNNSRNGMCYT